ncbi:MAG TPA: hypothetical protein VIQ30_18195, partial [Pseudonocardia sp.]
MTHEAPERAGNPRRGVVPPARRREAAGLRADLLAVAAAVALVAAAALAGWSYLRAGQDIILPFPPLMADWQPHV